MLKRWKVRPSWRGLSGSSEASEHRVQSICCGEQSLPLCEFARSALWLAHWLGAETVAVPMLGAGSGGASEHRALKFIREEAGLFVSRFARIELVRYAPESHP